MVNQYRKSQQQKRVILDILYDNRLIVNKTISDKYTFCNIHMTYTNTTADNSS